MRKLLLAIAIVFSALTGTSSAQVLIPNGDFNSGLTNWLSAGNVHNDSTFTYNDPTNVGLLISIDTLFPASPTGFATADMNPIYTALGGPSQGWVNNVPPTASPLDGKNSPAPLQYQNYSPPITSTYSTVGSVIYRDLTGVTPGTTSLLFDWNFVTSERTPSTDPPQNSVDFAFISIQSDDATQPQTLIRLADTTSPLLTNNGPSNGIFSSDSSSQTNMHTASLVFPPSSTGNYRIAFGVINVNDGNLESALAIDNIYLTGIAALANTTSIDFGDVRYGTTSGPMDLTVTNTGNNPSTLVGTASTPSNNKFAGSGSFVLSKDSVVDPSTNIPYTFHPTARGLQTGNVDVESFDGDTNPSNTVSLTGTGVGPVYHSSTAPNGTLSLGVVSNDMSPPTEATLTLTNTTTDPHTGGASDPLVGLTILSATITGADASDFSFFDTGTQTYLPLNAVLQPNAPGLLSFDLKIVFNPSVPPDTYLTKTATLTIFTDQGVAFGASGGNSFVYTLSGIAGSLTNAPEPGSMALWGAMGLVGLATVVRKVRRRRVAR